MKNPVAPADRSSPGVKLPLSLACLFAACLLMGCHSDTVVDPPPPPTNVACGDLQTGLEGGVVPATLSATGLFQDIRTRTLAPDVRTFEPNYKLWSDGAEKVR